MRNGYPQFFIIIVFGISAILLFALSVEAENAGLTTLRVVGKPEGLWRKRASGLVVLRRVQAEIRNVGSHSAEGIRVEAVVPGGVVVQLRGPVTLQKNKKATYTASPSEYATGNKDIEVRVTCKNCRGQR